MELTEAELIEEAKKCDNCLDWHKHCKAECCSLIFIKSNLLKLYSKGNMLIVNKTLSPDDRWYFKLHGVQCLRGELRFPKENIYIQHNDKNTLLYMRKCNYLLPDYKCKGHPDKKPLICKRLTEAIAKDNLKGIELTHNCLYRYKKLGAVKDAEKDKQENK